MHYFAGESHVANLRLEVRLYELWKLLTTHFRTRAIEVSSPNWEAFEDEAPMSSFLHSRKLTWNLNRGTL